MTWLWLMWSIACLASARALYQRNVQKQLAAAELEWYLVRHPDSEALRSIYREIDAIAEITDPDLATPEAPQVEVKNDTSLMQSAAGVFREIGATLQGRRDPARPIGAFPPAGKPQSQIFRIPEAPLPGQDRAQYEKMVAEMIDHALEQKYLKGKPRKSKYGPQWNDPPTTFDGKNKT